MHTPHVVIIGGGLAGLSTGCYARASEFQTTIVEQSNALGGVCNAWQRGAYTIDGCIHWLHVGPFERLYRELGIVPRVLLRPLESLAHYRNTVTGIAVELGSDLSKLAAELKEIAPEDHGEIDLLVDIARQLTRLDLAIDRPRELAGLCESIGTFWSTRRLAHDICHFRKPLSGYTTEHIRSVPLRRLLSRILPDDPSALLLPMMLGYLERGALSRPAGGSTRFRDALVDSYHTLGGTVRLDAMVEEVLVEHGRARGVRLADGAMIDADYVVSTSSLPETLLQLLRGQFGLSQHHKKLDEWKMAGPLLLVSFGIARPLSDIPGLLILDQVPRFRVGGRSEDHLHLRVFTDEATVAPPGSTVVQALLSTDYHYWATRRRGYQREKARVAESVLAAIEAALPGIADAVRMTDVATPITYWRAARSWRGAYEGFRFNGASWFGHIDKRLDGLSHFYLAGQWVEPGGGIPMSLLSGRQAAQLLCADANRPFVPGIG